MSFCSNVLRPIRRPFLNLASFTTIDARISLLPTVDQPCADEWEEMPGTCPYGGRQTQSQLPIMRVHQRSSVRKMYSFSCDLFDLFPLLFCVLVIFSFFSPGSFVSLCSLVVLSTSSCWHEESFNCVRRLTPSLEIHLLILWFRHAFNPEQ
jgi:hypothetical protein